MNDHELAKNVRETFGDPTNDEAFNSVMAMKYENKELVKTNEQLRDKVEELTPTLVADEVATEENASPELRDGEVSQ